MARSNSTLGYRFAKSNFLANTISNRMALHLTEGFTPGFSSLDPQSTDAYLAELMETLRLHINDVLRVTLPAQKRSRLLRNYWELEYLVKEVRLLIDPLVLAQLETGQVRGDVSQSP